MPETPTFSTLRVEVDGPHRTAHPHPTRQAEPTRYGAAAGDRRSGSMVRHDVGVGGDRHRRGPGVLVGFRSPRVRRDRLADECVEPRPGRPRTADGRGDGADVGVVDRGDQGSVRRRWCGAGRRVRSADRRRRHRVLDPRGRPRHPAGVGRDPSAGARDRTGDHPRAGADLPPVRARRGQGDSASSTGWCHEPNWSRPSTNSPSNWPARRRAWCGRRNDRSTRRSRTWHRPSARGPTPTSSAPPCVTPKPARPPATTSPSSRQPLNRASGLRAERLGRANGTVTQTGFGSDGRGQVEEVGGDVVEEAGGERERLDVDALVVAVEP